MRKRTIVALGCALAAFGLAAIGQAQEQQPPPPPVEKDIYETAASTEKLKTFAQVVDMVELKDSLKSKGDKEAGFTVFAPTEEAFSKLPKPVLDKLLADKKLLKEVIQYHIVSGKSRASELPVGKTMKSVQGETLAIKVEDGATWVNGAKVVGADTSAANGFIHQIDIVLIPPSVAQKLGIGT